MFAAHMNVLGVQKLHCMDLIIRSAAQRGGAAASYFYGILLLSCQLQVAMTALPSCFPLVIADSISQLVYDDTKSFWRSGGVHDTKMLNA
jgi:hypothetical protein